jgi:ADP-heptose:LPS heptosyltransferase
MKLIVPAGVGDWSWIWSKLCHVKDTFDQVLVVDGAPRRTVPYVKACGIDADYDMEITNGRYTAILTFESQFKLDWLSKPTWAKIQSLNLQSYLQLEANQHLEHGIRLEEWLPDLPTDFHYPLYVSDEDREWGIEITRRAIEGDRYSLPHPMPDGPIVGISCASYRGAAAWDTWEKTEWVDFLRRVMSIGWRPLLVGGDWDDLTYAVACTLNLPSTVGKTSVPQMITQMGILDSYIGFSSGMNVIRTVLNKPAMALWPSNEKCDQRALSTSWVPPHMLRSERYVATTWRPVSDVWPIAKQFLRRCERELAVSKSNGAMQEVASA